MEAIFLLPVLVAELLVVCLTTLIPVMILGLQVVLELVMLLVGVAFDIRHARKPAGKQQKPQRPYINAVWRRRLRVGFVALFALASTTILLINFVFFESTLRFAFGRLQASRGIAVSFESASGNLFAGSFALSGVHAVRSESTTNTFDVGVEKVTANVAMWSLLSSTKIVDSLVIEGIRGRVDKVGRKSKVAKKLKRHFEATHLEIRDVEILFRNKINVSRPLEVNIQVERLTSRPLRSRWLIFDMLFRSNSKGLVGGQPFFVESIDKSKTTTWKVNQLPVSVLATFLGGPLVWLVEGRVDVDVRSTWLRDTGEKTYLHWKTNFEDLRVEIPPGIGMKKRVLWMSLAAFMNKHGKRLPLEFELRLTNDKFQYSTSEEAHSWLNLVAEAMIKELAVAVGVPLEKIRDASAKEASNQARGKMRAIKENFLKRLKQ